MGGADKGSGARVIASDRNMAEEIAREKCPYWFAGISGLSAPEGREPTRNRGPCSITDVVTFCYPRPPCPYDFALTYYAGPIALAGARGRCGGGIKALRGRQGCHPVEFVLKYGRIALAQIGSCKGAGLRTTAGACITATPGTRSPIRGREPAGGQDGQEPAPRIRFCLTFPRGASAAFAVGAGGGREICIGYGSALPITSRTGRPLREGSTHYSSIGVIRIF